MNDEPMMSSEMENSYRIIIKSKMDQIDSVIKEYLSKYPDPERLDALHQRLVDTLRHVEYHCRN